MGDPAGGNGHQAQVSWLRTRIDAAPQQGGKEHPQDPGKGGKGVNQKFKRAIALVLVIVLVLAMVASMLMPFVAG